MLPEEKKKQIEVWIDSIKGLKALKKIKFTPTMYIKISILDYVITVTSPTKFWFFPGVNFLDALNKD